MCNSQFQLFCRRFCNLCVLVFVCSGPRSQRCGCMTLWLKLLSPATGSHLVLGKTPQRVCAAFKSTSFICWCFSSTMVDSEDAMPVAVIGPFIDRLDHIQHKLLKDPNSRIDSMRAMLSDHEAKLLELQASFSSTVSRPADMSRMGPRLCCSYQWGI